jgi:hypothetical protein
MSQMRMNSERGFAVLKMAIRKKKVPSNKECCDDP